METEGLKISREMLRRELPYGVDYPDRLLRTAQERLGQIERAHSLRGEHPEAFAATTESVELYRRLAEQNPGRHGADCARALLVFAEVRMAADGSLTEARVAAEEAVARYQQLARDLPEAYAPDLAQARSVLDRMPRQ